MGLLAYLPGLVLAIIYLVNGPNASPNDYDGIIVTAVLSLLTSGLATLIVLVSAIALVAIPRTRAFGAGLSIALAIGVIGGAGVCATMISVG